MTENEKMLAFLDNLREGVANQNSTAEQIVRDFMAERAEVSRLQERLERCELAHGCLTEAVKGEQRYDLIHKATLDFDGKRPAVGFAMFARSKSTYRKR